MAVYVDRVWYHGTTPNMPYPRSCHLMADTRAELMAFAYLLGLKREWLHRNHFDITPSKRKLAKQLGALDMPGTAMPGKDGLREKVQFLRRIREQWQQEQDTTHESTYSS